MSTCRTCGKPIKWIELKSGKKMPVDPDSFELWESEKGDTVVTSMGEVISFDAVKHAGDAREVYVSHFATCPQADNWRNKKK